MGNFEETYIYPRILSNCLFYCRFIDDIFLIYKLPESNINEFINYLNTRHDFIKFDHEISKTKTPFLVTMVYIDNYRKIQTTLYKETQVTTSQTSSQTSNRKPTLLTSTLTHLLQYQELYTSLL